MKRQITVTQPVKVVDEVVCDLTGQSCEVGLSDPFIQEHKHDPEHTDCRFEYAELKFSGGYWGDYDMLRFSMQVHPSVAVGLYAASLPEEQRRELEETYKIPKVRIVVEE